MRVDLTQTQRVFRVRKLRELFITANIYIRLTPLRVG